MKQFFSYLGASLAAIAALVSCNKELEAPVEDLKGGVPFEICASTADTKTSIDGFATSWVAGDAINLFHAVADTDTYTSDGEFTISAENPASNKFTGTLPSSLEAGNYDWYAFYPYSIYNKTPAGSSESNFGFTTIGGKAQTQERNNSTAHLSGKPCPLYGVVKSVASNVTPKVEMNHLTSIIEVNVTNNSGEDLTVSNVSFTGTEDIVGFYYVNFAGASVVYTKKSTTEVSNTVSLSVAKGTAIANGASAQFYVAVKPFTAPSGQTLKVSVNGYEKEIHLTKDVTFTAGKIKKVNFDVDKVIVDYVTLPWSIDGKGGNSVYSSTPGLSAFGLGSDYTKHSPYLTRFDDSGDYIQIKTDSQIEAVSIGVKMIGGNTASSIDVLGSADGSNYSTVQTLTISGAQASTHSLSTTNPFNEKYRYVKLSFNKGSNVGVGPISISKTDTRTALNTPVVVAEVNTENVEVTNSINVHWGAIDNAGSYLVTATPAKGDVVNNTVSSDGRETYDYIITGLAYETEYTISVVAKSSNTDLYKDSEAGEYSEKVKTGVKPSTGEDPTKQTVFLETFGSNSSNTAVASYTGYSATANMFTTSGDVNTHYSGSGSVGKNNLSSANLSSGYADASGLSGCYHVGTANTEKTILQISNIDITDCTDISISFGALGATTSHKINVFYKIDDGAETALITNGALTNANWTLLSGKVSETGKSLTLIFKHTPTKAWTIRIDDIKVVGTK